MSHSRLLQAGAGKFQPHVQYVVGVGLKHGVGVGVELVILLYLIVPNNIYYTIKLFLIVEFLNVTFENSQLVKVHSSNNPLKIISVN